ncbi:MAG: M81 family metallopeptidase [Pseudomonadota bacterium]
MTRVFCAALATETNTFGPLPTERRHFEDWFLYPAGEHPNEGPTLFTGPLWVARQKADEWGWIIHEGLCAAALPSGRTVRRVYEDLRDELLNDLRRALPVDIVLLGVHGAMCADGYDDCEGDLIGRVREIVGPSATVGVELDPHCHLTDDMMAPADIVLAFHEYPHTDALERAEKLVDLCQRAHSGAVTPVTAVMDLRASTFFYTKQEPTRQFVQAMQSAESRPGVLSVSLGHSFASGDVEEMTAKVWVTTNGDRDLAMAVSQELGEMAWDIRETASEPRKSVAEVLAEMPRLNAPIVLAEGADNPGGGAPSDATEVLRHLMRAEIGPLAAGPIWDPGAAAICRARGEGARFSLRIGGKASALSGAPLDLDVEVIAITEHATQNFGGSVWPLGTVVGLRSGDTCLSVCTVRNQAFTRETFAQAGIDCARMSVILVKSNHHFRDDFSALNGDIIYLASQGIAVFDPSLVDYDKIRRPLWPIDPAGKARAAQTLRVIEQRGRS